MVQEQTRTAGRQGQYFYGTGRRKTAIARVRLYPGSGAITINEKPFMEVLPWLTQQTTVRKPLQIADGESKFDVVAKVQGGGLSAWSDAISLGITRALIEFNPDLKPTLRRAGLVTRDPRIKERKKYGLKRARKAPQYTKR
ncbi:MAG TPA: 30S ribosomal protein S9 [Dehalococcoidia bacterium]|nr:30S ribosomal protein S9 [Dehalococcoidia bacterium]